MRVGCLADLFRGIPDSYRDTLLSRLTNWNAEKHQ